MRAEWPRTFTLNLKEQDQILIRLRPITIPNIIKCGAKPHNDGDYNDNKTIDS